MITPEDFAASVRELEADLAIQASEDAANEESETDALNPMTESEVQGIVKQMLQDSSGGGDTDDRGVSGVLKMALDYYFGRPRGDELEGRSWQQSLDVADMVESVLAETTPMFANDTQVVFGALDEEDEDQAQEESRVVNHVIMQQNNGYVLLYSTTKDALLQKNGIVEVYIDERVDVQIESLQNLSEMGVMMALQPKGPYEQVVQVSQEDNGDGTFDIELKRVCEVKKLVVDPVPPEDFYYYTGWDRLDLQNCPFTARRRIQSRSDLLEHGYDPDIVKSLTPYTSKDDQVSVSRNQFSVNDATRYTSSHFATDPIEVYHCYAFIDKDGDGIAELRYIVVAGRSAYQILEDSPATHTPFASGTPYIQPHRFLGRSLFDKLWDVQDGKTTVLRQWDDNINNMNNARVAADMERINNPDEMFNSRPGGVVDTMGAPGDAIMPFPRDDIGPSCNLYLEYYDRISARRAGASVNRQSSAQSIPGNVGSLGLDRLMTAEEQMAAMMARNFGETLIRNLYLLVHKTLRLNYAGEVKAKIGGAWVNTNPAQWKARDDIEVTVGLSGSERIRKMGVLTQVLSQQVNFMSQGADGVLVDDEKIHNTLTDYAGLGGLSHPERYWIDPKSPQAQQTKQVKSQQQMAEMQERMQAMQAQMGMQQQIAQAEVEKARAQVMRVQIQGQLEAMKQEYERIKAQEGDAQQSEEMAYKYAQLADQHMQWLTELEAKYGQDYSQQAQENAPRNLNG